MPPQNTKNLGTDNSWSNGWEIKGFTGVGFNGRYIVFNLIVVLNFVSFIARSISSQYSYLGRQEVRHPQKG